MEPQGVAAEFLGRSDGGGVSVQDAEAALERAKADFERLRSVRGLVEQEQRAAEHQLQSARREVELRAQKVVQAEHRVADFLAAAREAHESLIRMRVVLRHLLRHVLVADAEGDAVARLLRDADLSGAPPYGGLSGSVKY